MTSPHYLLIIGRFQPPCLHHLEFFKEGISRFCPKTLLVGVGVASSFDDRNFLKYSEVETLLLPLLHSLKINYKIVAIPDINHPPGYAAHVKKIIPEISETNTILFTENTYTSDCFINYGHNFKIAAPTILPTHATIVRELIKSKGDYSSLVPPHVAHFLKKKKI